MTLYWVGFLLAAGLVAGLTPVVRSFALTHGIMDKPDKAGRKIHKEPVAYLGGVAIFVGFVATVLLLEPLSRQLAALIMGGSILVVVGVVDDVRGLDAMTKLIWQFVAAGVALAGGIGIYAITNPLGGVIDLSWGRTSFVLLGVHFHITPVANAVSLLWMVGLANTVNFLDGLDGLAGGVSGIAAVVMFALAASPQVHQPAVALLAIILAGAAFGWLPFNFYPAKIFMGDSGAYFLGLTLAMLAIYSGAKLATAALVLGFPILDAVWVATRRLVQRQSPFQADRKHFHHLLIDAGMTQRQAVLTLYGLAAAFGAVAVMAGSFGKLVAMIIMILLMTAAISLLLVRGKTREVSNTDS